MNTCPYMHWVLSGEQWGVEEEEGWRRPSAQREVSRCGATKPTGPGPSGRVCANLILHCSALLQFGHGERAAGREKHTLRYEILKTAEKMGIMVNYFLYINRNVTNQCHKSLLSPTFYFYFKYPLNWQDRSRLLPERKERRGCTQTYEQLHWPPKVAKKNCTTNFFKPLF